ncbi:MAG: glucose-1-phosphate thymidylyltransferase RfbA [Bacilli bacterium]|nr:glucose-1-phosphate thymidylyltransferase RfbA [Bacilli bacterium]
MKGIILAAGKATRLYPTTLVTSKMLLPVYDKPLIYYPLAILMAADIKDILIISSEQDIERMQQLLGDGKSLGIKIHHLVQPIQRGISDAFILGEDFIDGDDCALILGDNIFYGSGLETHLQNAARRTKEFKEATIFGYLVDDPKRFGIVELDAKGMPISIEEKPAKPKSNYCVTGLYFYPSGVTNHAKKLVPSPRGELEITDLNNIYLKNHQLNVEILDQSNLWIDAGTYDSLIDANQKVQAIEKKDNIVICSPEAIAYQKGWISLDMLNETADKMKNSSYGKYLKDLISHKDS